MQSAWIATSKSLSDIEVLIKARLERLTDTHLTIPQAYVLQALNTKDAQRPADLAKFIMRPATSFTPILDGMENEGLTIRTFSKNDRRSVLITLTNKGRVLAKVVSEALAEVEREL